MMTILTPEIRAELAAIRAEEARIEAERTEASQPWNAPPRRHEGVASTVVLYEPPPARERDPIAGPVPVAPEDHKPVAVTVVGPGSLLAAFAASRFAEQHPHDSVKQRLLGFIGSSNGLGMSIRLPVEPARRKAREEQNRDRANMGWPPLPETPASCDWTTWQFLLTRATWIGRGR